MCVYTLFFSPSSPYTRKIHMLAIECGIDEKMEVVPASPLVESEARRRLLSQNPLGKLPTLVTPDGIALYDSRVICECLAAEANWPAFRPGLDIWRAKRTCALADGILDCAFSLVMEERRLESERSTSWQARWRDNIERSLDALANDVGALDAETRLPGARNTGQTHFDLTTIGTLCVVDYLDFRLLDLDLVPTELRDWRRQHSERQSVVRTMPSDASPVDAKA
ncbi:MAG: glutathione S-transferase N-terminal domain-containing protein [Pseudomonadota bacterium]